MQFLNTQICRPESLRIDQCLFIHDKKTKQKTHLNLRRNQAKLCSLDPVNCGWKRNTLSQDAVVCTWFLALSISRLVTSPKGTPRLITSASVMSLGSLRMWMTLDGTLGPLMSPLNFLLSLPLATEERKHSFLLNESKQRQESWCWTLPSVCGVSNLLC